MKERSESCEDLLERAERLLSRGNFPLALQEFQRAAKLPGVEGLEEKIALCRRESDRARGREVAKKARRLCEKGSLAAARDCFEEAFRLAGEEWMARRAEELGDALSSGDAEAEGRRAEAEGRYLDAADLFGKAGGESPGAALSLDRARCLLRGGKYPEAADLYEALALERPGDLYDGGYALARSGRYTESLRLWDRLPQVDGAFAAQAGAIRDLAATVLLGRLAAGEDPGPILERASGLLLALPAERRGPLAAGLVSALWDRERWLDLARLLRDLPEPPDAPFLALRAKVAYRAAQASPEFLEDLGLFWLSALFHPQVEASLGPDEAVREGAREELLRMAGAVLEQGAQAQPGEGGRLLMKLWSIERSLLTDLRGISRAEGSPLPARLLSPRLARRWATGPEILRAVRKWRNRFGGKGRYLRAAAFFTEAGEALLLAEAGDRAAALDALRGVRAGDETTAFGVRLTLFRCGLQGVLAGDSRSLAALSESEPVLDVPGFMEELVSASGDAAEPEPLRLFEEYLTGLLRRRPSAKLRKAAADVIARRAVEEFHGGSCPPQAMLNALKKALALDPKNAAAAAALESGQAAAEILEMDRALYRLKMGKAASMAAESRYDEVRRFFFRHFGEVLDIIHVEVPRREERLFLLREILEHCTFVDPRHPILDRIEDMIEDIEGEGL